MESDVEAPVAHPSVTSVMGIPLVRQFDAKKRRSQWRAILSGISTVPAFFELLSLVREVVVGEGPAGILRVSEQVAVVSAVLLDVPLDGLPDPCWERYVAVRRGLAVFEAAVRPRGRAR
ncbi:hypothetical protein ACFC0M_00350 [Streptomyces sp. NPDC056149]|uniref:hypothetical protein n=1 Tax=Streptomyces sp. NPDC056149 TaxID=3345728 RepID=UPI0035E2B53C